MIHFLTSNEKKALDFKLFGFPVKTFNSEIPEVKSPSVEEVAIYKAKDTGLNNIMVEDTAFYIEKSNFLGTEIKHVYDEIMNDHSLHGKKATWKLSICVKKDDYFYISTGKLNGFLNYPKIKKGYHFERFFAVETENGLVQYPLLPNHVKQEINPRYIALRKLHNAIINDDFSSLIKIHEKQVPIWKGEYQIEKVKQEKKMKF